MWQYVKKVLEVLKQKVTLEKEQNNFVKLSKVIS